jgi:predicted DNA-binding transcriptional regulator AlpA
MEPLLDINQVAAILGVQTKTLYKWHRLRQGPPVAKLGGKVIRYRPEDVRRFIDEALKA